MEQEKKKRRTSNKDAPSVEEFQRVTSEQKGFKKYMAKAFGISRSTLDKWIAEDTTGCFKEILRSEKGGVFDDCFSRAYLVAMGIPEKDEEGNVVGWRIPPDSNMLRYLMSKLGTDEGFGDEVAVTLKQGDGVPIARWLQLNATNTEEE